MSFKSLLVVADICFNKSRNRGWQASVHVWPVACLLGFQRCLCAP
jgi:hypothetical protein